MAEDFDWYESYLKIQDKQTGRIVPFKANSMQRKLRKILNDIKRRRGFVRAIILKARKEGISTQIEATLFRQAVMVPNIEALVMAHDDVASNAIFRMTKRFRDECPIKMKEKYSNRKEIEFDAPHRSAIRVNTAGTESFGRGDTRHLVHISELAFWSDAAGAETLNSVLNSVPDADGTFIVIESTANGVGGPFYDMWRQASANGLNQEGVNGYTAIFFSWGEDDNNRLEGVSLDDPRWDKTPAEWLEDEPRLKELGYDVAQLCWRRWAIGAKCQGSVDKFMQEYPATPEEAFISTGRPVFPMSVVSPAYEKALKAEETRPAKRYTIPIIGEERTRRGEAAELIEDSKGQLRIWEQPRPGAAYLLTADIARGVAIDEKETEGYRLGDYSTFGIFHRETRREVAVWHGRMDPDLFAEQIYHLGKKYNWAELCPEANHYGVITVKALLRMNYPKVHRKEAHDRPTAAPLDASGSRSYMEHGWWTTPASKEVMISDLNRLVRERMIHVHEPEALKEMLTYIRKPDGRTEAQAGCYDDRVMRLAIAATLMINEPYIPPSGQSTIQPYTLPWFKQKEKDRTPEPSGVISIC